MKVILSRKGMDSSFGGHPSLILPDNKMVHIPIPGDEDEIYYRDVFNNNTGKNMYQLLKEYYSNIYYYNWKTLNAECKCHLDPDLDERSFERKAGWRGAFGQGGAAQTVLEKSCVQRGDLFLFFGWFQSYTEERKKCSSDKQGGRHVVYGYMEIGDILYTKNADIPDWLSYHPHVLPRRLRKEKNCIYIANESLSWNKAYRGYGLFEQCDDSLILTKKGYSRSKWDLPESFRDVKVTYHSANSWKEDYFQSACRGQEFVFEENKEVEKWAKEIVERNGFSYAAY